MVGKLALSVKSGEWPWGAWAAIGAELWSSYWMFHSIPTDNIRAVYPTTWSYVGEHFLVWIVIAAPLFVFFGAAIRRVRSNTIGLFTFIAVVAASVVAEVAGSAYLWYVATIDGEQPKLWYEWSFWSYMRARMEPWLIAFIVLLLIELGIDKWRHRVSTFRQKA